MGRSVHRCLTIPGVVQKCLITLLWHLQASSHAHSFAHVRRSITEADFASQGFDLATNGLGPGPWTAWVSQTGKIYSKVTSTFFYACLLASLQILWQPHLSLFISWSMPYFSPLLLCLLHSHAELFKINITSALSQRMEKSWQVQSSASKKGSSS